MQEQCTGTVLGRLLVAETVAARLPMRHRHWRRVGSRAADEGRKLVDRERLLPPFLPPPAVRVTVACNKNKNAQQAVGFIFYFGPDPFSSLVFSATQYFLFVSPFPLCFQAVGGCRCVCSCWLRRGGRCRVDL